MRVVFSFASPCLVLAVSALGCLPFSTSAEDAISDLARFATLQEVNQTADLIAAGERFLDDHPGSPGEDFVLLHLGRAFHGQKKYDDSIRTLSKLLESHPDSQLVTAAAMQRGESYRLTDRHAEMLPDFQRAYQGYKEAGDVNAAHAQYHMVQAYDFLKKPDEALAEAELLIEEYPRTTYARSAARLMKLEMPATPQLLPAGTEAPEVDLTILEGGATRSLSEFKGKIVVLDFWASWCGPCHEPMAQLQTYREEHPKWGDRVELIALSIDNTSEEASGHLEKNGWDKTLNAWAGAGGFQSKPAKDFKVSSIPAVYVVGPDGKVAAAGHPDQVDIPEVVAGLLK